jgi:hypothetical protein
MHRCVALLYCIFAIQLSAAAQNNSAVTLMDFVKIKEGKTAEALFFYENNWKVYRDLALKKKVIQSYELVKARPDSLNNFDLILITVYKDSAQFAKSEENFRSILTALRPNGPVLLNAVKPGDFRQNVFVKIVQPVYASSKKKKRK